MMRLDERRESGNAKAMLDMIPEFETEIEFARRAENPMALAYNQRHLAAIYREGSKELEKSLGLYQASLETRMKMGFRPLLPASYFSVGEVLADLSRTEAAIEMYKRSVTSAEAVGFRRYQFAPRIKIGELLRTEGRLSEARSYFTEALQAAESEAFQDGIGEAHRKLSTLH
jgi:tetratricopeptide (TPR) repeat protein